LSIPYRLSVKIHLTQSYWRARKARRAARRATRACVAAIQRTPARGGGRGGVRQGSKGPVPGKRRRALGARMEPRRVGQRTRAAWSSRPLPRPRPPPPRDDQLGEIEPDRFDLGVEIEARSAKLPPEAGFLEAPKRQSRIEEVVCVDPDGPGADGARGLQSLGHIARPHGRGEPVGGRVTLGDSVVDRLERDHGEDRAEDLLARDLHLVGDTVEDRGLDEVALARA